MLIFQNQFTNSQTGMFSSVLGGTGSPYDSASQYKASRLNPNKYN